VSVKDGPWDAKFTASLLLSNFAEQFTPEIKHYTIEQGNLIHFYADKIAKELCETPGKYKYTERK